VFFVAIKRLNLIQARPPPGALRARGDVQQLAACRPPFFPPSLTAEKVERGVAVLLANEHIHPPDEQAGVFGRFAGRLFI